MKHDADTGKGPEVPKGTRISKTARRSMHRNPSSESSESSTWCGFYHVSAGCCCPASAQPCLCHAHHERLQRPAEGRALREKGSRIRTIAAATTPTHQYGTGRSGSPPSDGSSDARRRPIPSRARFRARPGRLPGPVHPPPQGRGCGPGRGSHHRTQRQ